MKWFSRLFQHLVAWATLGGISISAVTVDELRADPELTPEAFARRFADFKFELGETVQRPEIFLARKKGDCDDFATLAADVLKAKGYTTRLIVVFMPKDIHVVCYVEETKSFLDFNRRNLAAPLVSSGASLADIADKVAESFRSRWHCVSEFTFRNGTRQFVFTDFPRENAAVQNPPDAKPASVPLVTQAP